MTWPTMREKIEQAVTGSPLRVGVCVVQFVTGEKLTVGSQQPVVTASVNKVPALIELLRQVDQQQASLGEVFYVTEDDYPTGGSPMRDEHLLPGYFTLEDLATRMIRDSDNTATNVVMTRAGRENIRTMLAGIGVNPAMVSPYAYTRDEPGRQYVTDHWEYTMDGYAQVAKTTAEDMARVLTELWSGATLSPGSRATALGIMLGTKDSMRLRGGLPKGTPLAHKAGMNSGITKSMPASWTGWEEAPGISHDAGILMLSGLEYAVVVLTEGNATAGSAVIREISAIVLDGMVGGKASNPVTAIYTDHGRKMATT